LLYRRPYDTINSPFIVKLNLFFGGVHIDINMCWIYFQRQHINRMLIRGCKAIKSIAYRTMQLVAFNVSVVDKEKLFASGFLGILWFAYITLDHKMRGIFHTGYQLPLVVLTEYADHPLTQFPRRQIKKLHVVLRKVEPYVGIGKSYPLKLLYNVFHFDGIRLQEIPSGRHVEKEVFNRYGCARWTDHRFLFFNFRAFNADVRSQFFSFLTGFHFHLGNSGN